MTHLIQIFHLRVLRFLLLCLHNQAKSSQASTFIDGLGEIMNMFPTCHHHIHTLHNFWKFDFISAQPTKIISCEEFTIHKKTFYRNQTLPRICNTVSSESHLEPAWAYYKNQKARVCDAFFLIGSVDANLGSLAESKDFSFMVHMPVYEVFKDGRSGGRNIHEFPIFIIAPLYLSEAKSLKNSNMHTSSDTILVYKPKNIYLSCRYCLFLRSPDYQSVLRKLGSFDSNRKCKYSHNLQKLNAYI